jgi:hypothetical protein
MKKALIALVATAVIVDGERLVIPAGQPLPDMKDKDRDELLAARAAREPVSEAADTPLTVDSPPADGAAGSGGDPAPVPAPAPKPAAKKKA